MEDVCTGCLCAGRKLYFIADTGFHQLYSQILNEIPVHDISQICVRVCWECCASLRRFQLFKMQVKHSYTELLWNVPPPTLPPRLSTHNAHNISYPDPTNDPVLLEHHLKQEELNMELDVIKTEVDDEHCEPETFVKDLIVKNGSKTIKKSKKKKVKKSRKTKVKIKKKEEPLPEVTESDGSERELCIDEELEYKEEHMNIEGEDKVMQVKVAIDSVENEVPKTKGRGRGVRQVLLARPPPLAPQAPATRAAPEAPASERPQCVECGKIFSSRKTYRYHLNVLHRGQNRYPCPRCGKVYQWKSNLGRHMRTHKAVDAGELHCSACDKSFASVATYRQHLRISRRHITENEFSFTCNECGKKFVNKTRLRDHIDWEHLNKIKFRCHICNKAYKCHTSLYVHEQNVHRNKEKKDNLCHVCGKSYQNPAKLKYHITALHTGETPYQCSQCSAAFGWYSSLYRHVREVHYKMKIQPKRSKKMKEV